MTLPAKPDAERWLALSLPMQMANIGSEVGRTAKWMNKGNEQLCESAFVRALDLYDLTIQYGRCSSPGRPQLLKELCRSRELFCEAYLNRNPNKIAAEEKYFMQFALIK